MKIDLTPIVVAAFSVVGTLVGGGGYLVVREQRKQKRESEVAVQKAQEAHTRIREVEVAQKILVETIERQGKQVEKLEDFKQTCSTDKIELLEKVSENRLQISRLEALYNTAEAQIKNIGKFHKRNGVDRLVIEADNANVATKAKE